MQTASLPIVVKGINLEVTPALEAHVRSKARKLERMFSNHSTASVEAVLRTGKEGHVAEITFYVGGYVLRGESRTPDMYQSINKAMDRIEGQLRKFKTKLSKKLRDQRSKIAFADAQDETSDAAWIAEADQADDKAPEIVRTKRFVVKPMSVDEAVMQMELLGHDFFVFVDAETNEFNIVYKRQDGRYGLLQPIYG